jgi:hypothetical protein
MPLAWHNIASCNFERNWQGIAEISIRFLACGAEMP